MSKATTLGQLEALGVAAQSFTAEVAGAAAAAIEAVNDMVATAEASDTASAAHTAGSYLILDDVLYKVTDDIAVGDTIEEGVNVSETSIADEMETFSDLTTGISYSAATETITIPHTIGSYADETIIFNL